MTRERCPGYSALDAACAGCGSTAPDGWHSSKVCCKPQRLLVSLNSLKFLLFYCWKMNKAESYNNQTL